MSIISTILIFILLAFVVYTTPTLADLKDEIYVLKKVTEMLAEELTKTQEMVETIKESNTDAEELTK